MDNCIFCKIIRGEIPSPRVAEGDDWIAIRDINPAAPVHVLVIPRRHVESVDALGDGDGALAGTLLLAVRDVARQEGVAASGYRTVVNTGAEGGQTVAHLHVHVIGGKQLTGHGTA
ncbi:MAG TPA: histidine triad nucleotide-binding protein [Longimicrobium sp.]|nr:histidine triad nucleotide-binding protein [Longimicrobium sp.]